MSSMIEVRTAVVLGCGTERSGDDAAGLEVVRRLSALGDWGPHHEFLTTERLGPELLDVFDRAASIVIVDAVVSAAPTGTIVVARLPAEGVILRHAGSLPPHGWGVPEAIALAQALGRPVPRLTLLGIDIEEAVPGKPMSGTVEATVEQVVATFGELMERVERMHRLGTADPQLIAPRTALV